MKTTASTGDLTGTFTVDIDEGDAGVDVDYVNITGTADVAGQVGAKRRQSYQYVGISADHGSRQPQKHSHGG